MWPCRVNLRAPQVPCTPASVEIVNVAIMRVSYGTPGPKNAAVTHVISHSTIYI